MRMRMWARARAWAQTFYHIHPRAPHVRARAHAHRASPAAQEGGYARDKGFEAVVGGKRGEDGALSEDRVRIGLGSGWDP